MKGKSISRHISVTSVAVKVYVEGGDPEISERVLEVVGADITEDIVRKEMVSAWGHGPKLLDWEPRYVVDCLCCMGTVDFYKRSEYTNIKLVMAYPGYEAEAAQDIADACKDPDEH